jgi:hypothetical protein
MLEEQEEHQQVDQCLLAQFLVPVDPHLTLANPLCWEVPLEAEQGQTTMCSVCLSGCSLRPQLRLLGRWWWTCAISDTTMPVLHNWQIANVAFVETFDCFVVGVVAVVIVSVVVMVLVLVVGVVVVLDTRESWLAVVVFIFVVLLFRQDFETRVCAR